MLFITAKRRFHPIASVPIACININRSYRSTALDWKTVTPTIKDVARLAGVSTATVSYVINNTRFVSEETRAKVDKAMEMLEYAPSALARGLRMRRTKTVGLIVPQLSNQYFTNAAHGIEEVLQRNGYSLIISKSGEDWEVEKKLVEVFTSLLVDGLIMVPCSERKNDLQKVLRGKYPIVFLDRRPTGFEGDVVALDNRSATREAVSLFAKAGHRKIALLVGVEWYSTTADRIAGYRQALADAGIGFDSGLIRHGDYSLESGLALAEDVFRKRKPTALLAASSDMTLGAFRKAREMGLKIPDQLAIIGCDDMPWANAIDPPLSMIWQPSVELGGRAAELLLKRIATPSEERETIFLPTRLNVRNSS